MPTLAILAWPVLTLAFFSAATRHNALLSCIVIGYLFLPQAFGIDLPGLPALDKVSIISISLIMAWALFLRPEPLSLHSNARNASPLKNQARWIGVAVVGLLALAVVNGLLTIATNQEPISIVQPAMSYRDFVATTAITLFAIIPFFVGRRFFATPDDHRHLLHFLLLAALAYSVFILYELRFAPVLHQQIYGFSQHSFLQHVRDGAYRPKVFLKHGLWVGLFLYTTVLAGTALCVRSKESKRRYWVLGTLWLLGILLISRNLGAVMITVLFLPVFFMRIRVMITTAAVVAVLFLTYPALRQANVIPLDRITNFAQSISQDRAESFVFRLRNEDLLLQRAALKPISGWGGWNRSQPSDEQGNRITTVDGLWIIILGSSGWLGYIAFFGLLVLPMLALHWTYKRKEVPIETAALSLIMAGNLVYLIPNSALSPIGWLMAGALAGFVQFDAKQQKVEDKEDIRAGPAYSRFAAQNVRTSL